MCIKGECTSSTQAPVDDCPFGDEIIVNRQVLGFDTPRTQMTCQNVFDYISTTLNQFPVAYCQSNANFRAACCNFCKSKNH